MRAARRSRRETDRVHGSVGVSLIRRQNLEHGPAAKTLECFHRRILLALLCGVEGLPDVSTDALGKVFRSRATARLSAGGFRVCSTHPKLATTLGKARRNSNTDSNPVGATILMNSLRV